MVPATLFWRLLTRKPVKNIDFRLSSVSKEMFDKTDRLLVVAETILGLTWQLNAQGNEKRNLP
jgi:hypothetical protein